MWLCWRQEKAIAWKNCRNRQPYTDEDLNYNDRTTRATAEQNDPDARPAIQGSITDFEQYERVYVGYPIWLAYHNLIQCTQA